MAFRGKSTSFKRRDKRTLREKLMDWKHEWIDESEVPGSNKTDANAPEVFRAPNAKEVGFAWSINNRGERKAVYLAVQRHTLVAGTTGGGKSVTTNAIITQLAQIGPPCPDGKKEDGSKYNGAYCALVGADLKGGIELAPWFPRMSFVATKLNEVDFLLDKLLEENERRTAFLRSQGEKKIKPNKKFPLIICIIDELAEVTASKETGKQYADAKKAAEKEGKEFDEYRYPQKDDSRQVKLRRLSAIGRSQGIFLIVATQKPSSKLIDTDFRDNFDQRLCHRVNTASNVTMILGVDDVNNLAPAHRFPGDMPGMMYAKVASHKDPIQCRSEYYNDDEIDTIAAATAHCRYDLHFLYMPGYLYHGSVMEEQAQKTYSIEEHAKEYEENKDYYDAMGYDDDDPNDIPPVITEEMVNAPELTPPTPASYSEPRRSQRDDGHYEYEASNDMGYDDAPGIIDVEPDIGTGYYDGPEVAEIDPDLEDMDLSEDEAIIDALFSDAMSFESQDMVSNWNGELDAPNIAEPALITIEELLDDIDIPDDPEYGQEGDAGFAEPIDETAASIESRQYEPTPVLSVEELMDYVDMVDEPDDAEYVPEDEPVVAQPVDELDMLISMAIEQNLSESNLEDGGEEDDERLEDTMRAFGDDNASQQAYIEEPAEQIDAETTSAVLVSTTSSKQPAASDPSRRIVRKQPSKLTATPDGLILSVPITAEQRDEKIRREQRRRENKNRKPVLKTPPAKQPKRSKQKKQIEPMVGEIDEETAKPVEQPRREEPRAEEMPAIKAEPTWDEPWRELPENDLNSERALEKDGRAGQSELESKPKKKTSKKSTQKKQSEPEPQLESIADIDTESLMGALMGFDMDLTPPEPRKSGRKSAEQETPSPSAKHSEPEPVGGLGFDDDDEEDESMDPDDWEWNEPVDDVPF